jgi:hypothetical protein
MIDDILKSIRKASEWDNFLSKKKKQRKFQNALKDKSFFMDRAFQFYQS